MIPSPDRSARARTAVGLLALTLAGACAQSRTLPAQTPPVSGTSAARGLPADSLDPSMVPAGFGSLKQEDLALRITPGNGLQVRAVPVDERVLRLLSPDSYRALSELVASKARELDAVKQRVRLPSYSIWYVSFYALEQGETRFSPLEFIINNVGRDFRPIDVVPLSNGFGEYRLKQRETQSALYLFDGALDVNQPLTGLMEGRASTTDWSRTLQVIERERALVRSRAAGARKDTTGTATSNHTGNRERTRPVPPA